MPFRIEFSTVGLVPEETYIEYARTNIAAGFPEVMFAAPHDVPLAIVGGGPSAARALDELKDWPGHIWGINQTASWLIAQGVKAPVWLFTVDPDPCLADWVSGVERALLGASCHPKLFEALKDKDVRLFHTREVPGVTRAMEETVNDGSNVPEIKCNLMGPSSVCRVFLPAAMQGYKDVTFFGCEGSIEEKTHAYRHEHRPRQMVIRAGDRDYITTPDFYITTLFLVNVMREFGKLKERSGGLLRAMLEYPDTWEVVAFSEELRNKLDPTATENYIPRVA
jgi:hypothetical protein